MIDLVIAVFKRMRLRPPLVSILAVTFASLAAPALGAENGSNVPLEDAEKLEDAQPVNSQPPSEAGKTIKAKPITSAWVGGGVTTTGDPSWNLGFRRSFLGLEVGGVFKDVILQDVTGDSDYELSFKADLGIDALLFIDLDDQYLSLYAGPGFYGLNYNTETEEYEDSTFSGTAGVRLSLARNFALGLGYHTVRGVNGSFVYRF